MSADDVCGICGERRSDHVPTDAGPLTHPREARGEGRYELVRAGYTLSGCMGGGPGAPDIDMPPVYRFVPAPVPGVTRGEETR